MGQAGRDLRNNSIEETYYFLAWINCEPGGGLDLLDDSVSTHTILRATLGNIFEGLHARKQLCDFHFIDSLIGNS